MNRTPVHFKPATEQPAGDVFVAKVTAHGPAAQDGTVPHAWTEQRFDPGSRAYVDMEVGGRSGTLADSPAYDLNRKTVGTGQYVYMRYRGRVDIGRLPEGQNSGPVYDVVRRCCIAPPTGRCGGNPCAALPLTWQASSAAGVNGTCADCNAYLDILRITLRLTNSLGTTGIQCTGPDGSACCWNGRSVQSTPCDVGTNSFSAVMYFDGDSIGLIGPATNVWLVYTLFGRFSAPVPGGFINSVMRLWYKKPAAAWNCLGINTMTFDHSDFQLDPYLLTACVWPNTVTLTPV